MGISIGTLIGMLVGVGLLLYNIVAKAPDLAFFIDVGSLLMVVGGTMAATFIAYKEVYVIGTEPTETCDLHGPLSVETRDPGRTDGAPMNSNGFN